MLLFYLGVIVPIIILAVVVQDSNRRLRELLELESRLTQVERAVNLLLTSDSNVIPLNSEDSSDLSA